MSPSLSGRGDDFSLLGKLKWKFYCCHSIFDHSLMAFCSKSFPPNIQILNSDNFLAVNRPSPGVSGNSRSPPFPRMKASDSRSRIMGMDFFIPFPFPNFGIAFFSFPSRSRNVKMIFHSLPVPELWKWFFIHFQFPNCGNDFSFTSRSQICHFTGIKTGIGILWEIANFQYF